MFMWHHVHNTHIIIITRILQKIVIHKKIPIWCPGWSIQTKTNAHPPLASPHRPLHNHDNLVYIHYIWYVWLYIYTCVCIYILDIYIINWPPFHEHVIIIVNWYFWDGHDWLLNVLVIWILLYIIDCVWLEMSHTCIYNKARIASHFSKGKFTITNMLYHGHRSVYSWMFTIDYSAH